MFNGSLIKIGTWNIPFKYIQPETFKVSSNKKKVVEWEDYDGNRHVVYSSASYTELTFQTHENAKIDDNDVALFIEALNNAKLSGFGQNVDAYVLTYYDPRFNNYFTKNFTLDDLDFEIERVTRQGVVYTPLTFKFKEVASIEL